VQTELQATVKDIVLAVINSNTLHTPNQYGHQLMQQTKMRPTMECAGVANVQDVLGRIHLAVTMYGHNGVLGVKVMQLIITDNALAQTQAVTKTKII